MYTHKEVYVGKRLSSWEVDFVIQVQILYEAIFAFH